MERFKEHFFKVEGPKEKTREVLEKYKIPEEEWQTLETIAKRVGGDFRMKVKLGKPGEGNFFNTEDSSITFDPLDIKEGPEQAKFIAGHEGSHRAITPGPKEIGLSQEQIENDYSSRIAFAYLQNAIEDPAVNDWMMKRFPGLKEYTKRTYDELFKKENAVLSTPAVRHMHDEMGYWPKFAQYGSEVIRDWHQKRFSKKLDPAVEKALKRTIDLARESINTIPDPQKPILSKKEIIAQAQRRFEINTKYIWPEVKKLVEMDLGTEEQRQMIIEIRQKQKELAQKRKELKEAQEKGDKQRQEELQKEIEGLEKELDPFNRLPEEAKKELEEKIGKAIRETTKKLNREIKEKQKEIEKTKQRQEELDKEIKDLEEKAQKASGKEKEELEKQIEQKKDEKLEEKVKQGKTEKELRNTKDTLGKIVDGVEIPYPVDKLSERMKRMIEKLFRSLPPEVQKKLRQRAERKLEDFEDEANKKLRGKLIIDRFESHKERREREKQDKKAKEERKKTEREREELERKLEEKRRERMTEYDKAYEQVADIINSLYVRLKKFFLPKRHPKWRKDYPSGSRVNLQKAMQAEADPRYLQKIWEIKTIPHKFDYRFSLLVDTSGSMAGEKIEETFKGVVALAEVLEKLGIQYEITAFSDSSCIFKQWREKLNKERRDYLSQIENFGGGGTKTTEATQKAYQEFLKNLGKDNFLLTFTDGRPDNSESLKQLLEKIKKEGRVKLVGIGLGPDTEFVKDFYKAAISIPKVKITEEERRQGQKDFAEAFADLLEDMIKHPEKY